MVSTVRRGASSEALAFFSSDFFDSLTATSLTSDKVQKSVQFRIDEEFIRPGGFEDFLNKKRKASEISASARLGLNRRTGGDLTSHGCANAFVKKDTKKNKQVKQAMETSESVRPRAIGVLISFRLEDVGLTRRPEGLAR